MSSPSSQASTAPPAYILVSCVSSSSSPAATGPCYTTFTHPAIEYHYADDSPSDLLPQSPSENVLVLDYDPTHANPPVAQSLSVDLTVQGVKVSDAPGATVKLEDRVNNSKIYVVDTTIFPHDIEETDRSPYDVLTEYKQRNAVIRRVLDYPNSLPDA